MQKGTAALRPLMETYALITSPIGRYLLGKLQWPADQHALTMGDLGADRNGKTKAEIHRRCEACGSR